MSAQKKSPLLMIVFILLVLGAGYFLWSMVGAGGKSEMPNVENQMAQTEPETALNTETLIEPDMGNVGETGTVTQLEISPILGRRALGNPNAPVQVREYFSLTCHHCADFHNGTFKELKTKYIDTGKIYFIYEEMPLNGPALYGSMIARCLPEERYAGFIALLLETQEKWAFGGDFKTALQQNAALNGMNEDDFNACFNNDELRVAIANNIDASSQAWEIRSTPTFVFNDGERILRGGQAITAFDAVFDVLTDPQAKQEAEAASPFELESFDTEETHDDTGITTPVTDVEAFEPNGEVVTPEQNIE